MSKAFSGDTLSGFYVKSQHKEQDTVKLREEARNLFGSIDESKIMSSKKLEKREMAKNIDLENIRQMHKNELKFPAPLPKLNEGASNVGET